MDKLRLLLERDPGLPTPESTASYWLKDEHHLATRQSPSLAAQIDVAIIGSGITGLSAASALLQQQPKTSVCVLDARRICSGATGRNGGHLQAPAAFSYSDLKRRLGKDSAIKIIRLLKGTVEDVAALAFQIAPCESEIRKVHRLRSCVDQASLDDSWSSLKEYEQDFPETRGEVQFIDAKSCRDIHGIHGVLGAFSYEGYAMWPYKLVMRLWETLLQRYPATLSLEALTPVENIAYVDDASHPYHLATPRGGIRARKILHCTNAYASHLLPGLRGKLFPYRETMTVQNLKGVSNQARSNSWSFHATPTVEPQSGSIIDGWLYMQQNPETGFFFLGGTCAKEEQILTADDSKDVVSTVDYLAESLARFHGCPNQGDMIAHWTGIVGRTADHLPLVGPIPPAVSGRDGKREWIAAGFNGGGMCMSWRVGQALVALVLGKDVSSWFPSEMLLTEQRSGDSLSVQRSCESIKVAASPGSVDDSPLARL